jgi:recombination protein RecT
MVSLNNQLASRADQFKMVLPQHISPDKFQRTILTAVQNDPQLLDADRQSLLLACMRCAQDGLLPDKREAALVIFKENKNVNGQWQTKLLVQYMPMVYGLRKKILQSGEITDIFTQVVYRQEIENGNFIYEEGTERMLRHKPILDPDFEPKDDDLVLAYSIATFSDGSKSFEVMRRSEIAKVQEKSQTGATRDRKGQPRTPSGPWVEWKSEQWRKTVMRRHSKSLPMSGDILDIEARDDDIAARSTQAVLAAPQVAPALASVPTRAQLAAGDDIIPADVTVLHDADGVILDEQPAKVEAKPKKAKAEPKPEPAAAVDGDGADAGEQALYEEIEAKLNRADTVIAVKRAKDQIPDAMRQSWRDSLITLAEIKDSELREGAK